MWRKESIDYWREHARQAESRLKIAIEALEFYADEKGREKRGVPTTKIAQQTLKRISQDHAPTSYAE